MNPSVMVRARDILASEWIKFRSVRSAYWTPLITAVTAIGGSAIIALSGRNSEASSPFDPVAGIFVGWAEWPVIAVGVLGVLTFTSEYSSGQIRVTFSAVPHRLPVLAAKAAVAGLAALVAGEVLAFAAFFLSAAILSGHSRAISLSQPGTLGSVLAGGFVLTVVMLTGVALGAIIRHTAGAIIALPAVLYLPLLTLTLPQPWNDRIGRFTLLSAAYQVIATHPSARLFSPWLSLAVLLAWPAVALLAAAILLTRRDA